ncbi:hypothetical protein LXL04_015431 [Taraxacum kok-saghyz]
MIAVILDNKIWAGALEVLDVQLSRCVTEPSNQVFHASKEENNCEGRPHHLKTLSTTASANEQEKNK